MVNEKLNLILLLVIPTKTFYGIDTKCIRLPQFKPFKNTIQE